MDRITLFKQKKNKKHNTTIVHEHYLNTLREYAPGTDLYMREMHFIISADPENPVSISDLASSLDVTLGAASQMATKLEKKGLVSRFPDPGDRRRTMVSLTESGARLFQEHLEYDRRSLMSMSDMFHDFSDEEVMKLIEAERIFRRALHTKANE